MKGEIFVDSGAWLALAHDRDQYHPKASRIYPRLLADARRLITTNLVVAECHALLLKYKGREVALFFIDTIYIRLAKQGEELAVTERGKPVALIQALHSATDVSTLEARLARLAAQGGATLPDRKSRKNFRAKRIRGTPISRIILEDRR